MPEITIGLISWGAIFAGVVSILAFQMLFSMLGLSIGLRMVPSTDEPRKLGIGAATYMVITTLISVYFGTWIAGRFAGGIGEFNAMLHGVIAWGLSVLIAEIAVAYGTGIMLSGIFGAIRSAVRTVSGGMSQVMQTAGPGIQQVSQAGMSKMSESGGMRDQWDQMHRDIENLLRESGRSQYQPESNIENTIRKVFSQGKGIDRDAIVTVLEKETRISHQQAEAKADQWISTYQRARAKAEDIKDEAVVRSKEAVEQSAVTLSQLAFLSFLMMTFSLVVAMWGASNGAVL
jgi:hypothetical protein